MIEEFLELNQFKKVFDWEIPPKPEEDSVSDDDVCTIYLLSFNLVTINLIIF